MHNLSNSHWWGTEKWRVFLRSICLLPTSSLPGFTTVHDFCSKVPTQYFVFLALYFAWETEPACSHFRTNHRQLHSLLESVWVSDMNHKVGCIDDESVRTCSRLPYGQYASQYATQVSMNHPTRHFTLILHMQPFYIYRQVWARQIL